MGHRETRRSGGFGAVGAPACPEPDYRLGGEASRAFHLYSPHATPADPACSVSPGFGRIGRLAENVPVGIQRGARSALLAGHLACGHIWAKDGAGLGEHLATMVNADVVGLCCARDHRPCCEPHQASLQVWRKRASGAQEGWLESHFSVTFPHLSFPDRSDLRCERGQFSCKKEE